MSTDTPNGTAAQVLLRAKGLTRKFGGVIAVSDVSFDVTTSEILGVIGPNGAGKSTLLGLLSGGVQPSSGTVFFRGDDVTKMRPFARCRSGLARTFQIPRPFSELSVAENVAVGVYFGGSDDVATVDDILEMCALAPKASWKSGDLTHSDQRRLELARALATNPLLVLLDEVGAGLSDREIEQFAELVEGVRASGVGFVVVEHVMSFVMKISDRVLVMDEGRMIAFGSPERVVHDPAVIEAYFGGVA